MSGAWCALIVGAVCVVLIAFYVVGEWKGSRG